MRRFPKKPALLLRSSHDPDFLGGVIAECEAQGWRAINVGYADDYLFSQQSPIGVILANPPKDLMVEKLREYGIPIVCTSVQENERFTRDGRVFLDRLGAGRLAANAFHERGFKDLAFVTFERGVSVDDLRIGFEEQAAANGATLHLCRLSIWGETNEPGRNYEARLEKIAAMLTDLPKPLAVLGLNYRMAVRIAAACEMAGLAVPEQVAIAGQGNDESLCMTSPIPLSAIDMNRAELGRRAVRLMRRLVDGEKPPKDPIYVPVKGFVERRSTDILAVPDPRVAKAVRFIWDHLALPLVVDDVVHEIGVSRNTLERAFKRCLNRGINAELRRKRMERCQELLRGTQLSIAEIAKACGLSSTRHLRRSFQSAFDMSPNEYRRSRGT